MLEEVNYQSSFFNPGIGFKYIETIYVPRHSPLGWQAESLVFGQDGEESDRANGFQIDFFLNVFYMAKENARKLVLLPASYMSQNEGIRYDP